MVSTAITSIVSSARPPLLGKLFGNVIRLVTGSTRSVGSRLVPCYETVFSLPPCSSSRSLLQVLFVGALTSELRNTAGDAATANTTRVAALISLRASAAAATAAAASISTAAWSSYYTAYGDVALSPPPPPPSQTSDNNASASDSSGAVLVYLQVRFVFVQGTLATQGNAGRHTPSLSLQRLLTHLNT